MLFATLLRLPLIEYATPLKKSIILLLVSSLELKVIRPDRFESVSQIADHLLNRRTVVLNLELLDNSTMIRMLDFLNGVTYSIDGDIKNVSKSTFIITPNNVDVSDNE